MSTPLPWTSNYEAGGSLDDAISMPTLTDNVNTQSADSVNSLAESLIEVETHLGLPDGGSDITSRVVALESASSYIQFDNTYTDAWYSGASPKYNPTTGRLALGFHDEFPGSALDSGWTSSTGDDGVITVGSGSLTIQDGPVGTNYPYIRRPVVTAQAFEWKCHITMDALVNNSSMVVGIYSGAAIASNLYIITQLQRNGAGSNLMTFGSYGSIQNVAGAATAVWFRILVNSYGYMFCYSNNAHTSEPTGDQWVRQGYGVHGTSFVFPAYFFVFVTNGGATAANYTLRHLYFRYL